jgi:hypothetical protein
MSFVDTLERNLNRSARTENGALTNASTLNPNLDFFSLAGAMRNNIADARKLFNYAYYADAQTAVRTLFYLRDVRGGQGERSLFRELYKEFSLLDPTNANRLLSLIPEYGRWDDLFNIPANEDRVAEIVKVQLEKDKGAALEGKSVSLMAKWLPSENASSSVSRHKARVLASKLGMTNREYRQTLTILRSRIHLLESDMSEGKFAGRT